MLRPLYDVPRDALSPEVARTARFPALPGWWNPQLQPAERPAFQLVKGRGGTVAECVDDLPWLVQARKRALGLPPAAETAARPSGSATRLGFAATKARRGESPASKPPSTKPAPAASKQPPKPVKLQAELRAGMVPQKPARAAAAAAVGAAARGGKAAAAARRGKGAARRGKAAARSPPGPLRSSPWDATKCPAAPPLPSRDAGRGKRPREHEALEAPAATPAAAREQALSPSRPAKASRRLAFSELPTATGVAKNLEGAFGVLRKVGREVVALYS